MPRGRKPMDGERLTFKLTPAQIIYLKAMVRVGEATTRAGAIRLLMNEAILERQLGR